MAHRCQRRRGRPDPLNQMRPDRKLPVEVPHEPCECAVQHSITKLKWIYLDTKMCLDTSLLAIDFMDRTKY
jgi:hypothetical protein